MSFMNKKYKNILVVTQITHKSNTSQLNSKMQHAQVFQTIVFVLLKLNIKKKLNTFLKQQKLQVKILVLFFNCKVHEHLLGDLSIRILPHFLVLMLRFYLCKCFPNDLPPKSFFIKKDIFEFYLLLANLNVNF